MDRSFSSEAAQTALEAPSDCALRVPFYCEENVWRLAHRHSTTSCTTTNCHVVFISNARQCVAVYHQLAREDDDDDDDGPCFWDYHVILIKTENNEPAVVLDMDSRLSYPCPLAEYQKASFVQEGGWAPLFRVVEATVYLEHFSSDRSHMYNEETGEWKAPPPDYACIDSGPSNLRYYISMSDGEKGENSKDPFGVVMTLAELQDFFS